MSENMIVGILGIVAALVIFALPEIHVARLRLVYLALKHRVRGFRAKRGDIRSHSDAELIDMLRAPAPGRLNELD